MTTTLDHIVFAADDREAGRAAFKEATGLILPLGGEHTAMGTHNCVSRMSPDTYLELITVNPRGMKPIRPRWFGLDTLPADAALRAHTIVLRSNHIYEDITKAKEVGVDLGTPMALRRDTLSWKFAVRDDGHMPLDGTAPMLMQWDRPKPHPAGNMMDQHIPLIAITQSSPHADTLSKLYDALGWRDLTLIEGPPLLSFTLDINGKEVTI